VKRTVMRIVCVYKPLSQPDRSASHGLTKNRFSGDVNTPSAAHMHGCALLDRAFLPRAHVARAWRGHQSSPPTALA